MKGRISRVVGCNSLRVVGGAISIHKVARVKLNKNSLRSLEALNFTSSWINPTLLDIHADDIWHLIRDARQIASKHHSQ